MQSTDSTFFHLGLAYNDCYRDPYGSYLYNHTNSGPKSLAGMSPGFALASTAPAGAVARRDEAPALGWFSYVVSALNSGAGLPEHPGLDAMPETAAKPKIPYPCLELNRTHIRDNCASENPESASVALEGASGGTFMEERVGAACDANTKTEVSAASRETEKSEVQISAPPCGTVSGPEAPEGTAERQRTPSLISPQRSVRAVESGSTSGGASARGLSPIGKVAPELSSHTSLNDAPRSAGAEKPKANDEALNPTKQRNVLAEDQAGWPPLEIAADSVDKIVDGIQRCGLKAIALDDMRQQLIEAFHLIDDKKAKCGDAEGKATELGEATRVELACTLYTLRAHLQRLKSNLTEQETRSKQQQERHRGTVRKSKQTNKRVTVEIVHAYEEEPLPYKKPPFRKMSYTMKSGSRHTPGGKEEKAGVKKWEKLPLKISPTSTSTSYTPFKSSSYSLPEDYVSEENARKSSKSVPELTRSDASVSLEYSFPSSSKRGSVLSSVSSTLTSERSRPAPSPSRSSSSTATSSWSSGTGKGNATQGAARGGRKSPDEKSQSSDSDSSTGNLFWQRRAAALKQKHERDAAVSHEK